MAWVERQHPTDDEVFLDHVGYFVTDIEGSAAVLERLGFTVSPVNRHYNAGPDDALAPAGTANRLVTFGLGYIEVLGATLDTPLGNQLRAALARYEGLHLIALTHPDMEKTAARLAAAGVALQPVAHLRRPVETEEGERIVRATVVRATPGAMAEGRVQMLTHGTPELIWRPGLSRHANGAEALSDLLIVEADLDEAAARWTRFTGRPARRGGGLATLGLDRGRITLADAAAAHRLLPGIELPALPFCAAAALRVADLAATAAALRARGVTPAIARDGLVAIRPADALGAWIVFHGAGIEDAWAALGG